MAKRKIAECVNIRINVGNYQHIELTKYAEEEIDFESVAERVQKEDALREDLIVNMMRSMKAIPERLGKGIDQAVAVEEAIQKAIPAWLENGPVPNIANGAKEKVIQITAEQKNNKDSQVAIPEEKNAPKDVPDEPTVPAEALEAPSAKISDEDVKDLFEDDAPSAPAKDVAATPEPEKSEEVKKDEKPAKSAKDDLKEFFDDEDKDLFGEV